MRSNILSVQVPDITMPWPRSARVFACLGAVSLRPFAARYYAADGMPLLDVEEASVVAGVQPDTIHKWNERNLIQPRGLGDAGEHLWRADEIAAVRAAPRGQRQKVAA